LVQEEIHDISEFRCREEIGQPSDSIPLQAAQHVLEVGLPTCCQGGMPGSHTCRQDTRDASPDGRVGNAALDKVGRGMTRNKTSTGSQLRIGYHCHTKKWLTDWCGQPVDRRPQLDWAGLIDGGRFGRFRFKAMLGACGGDGSHGRIAQSAFIRMLRLPQ
jgi:hypothetical protein